MVELTELDGVADGRAENLTEAGYESVEDLVDADASDLADEVSYLPEDTALELIVQSQNIVAEEEAEVEESEPAQSVTEEVKEAVEESEDEAEEALEELPDEEEFAEEFEDEADPEAVPETIDEDEPEVEDETPDDIEFELTFDEALEFDTFFDAVMGQRASMLRSNRDGVDVFDHTLDKMRSSDGVGSTVELTMEEAQLNDLHNCVRQTMIEYKGDNLIDHMDALKRVLGNINEVRDEHLF